MTWSEVEGVFNRALSFSFSKKKLLFVFPILVVCGLLIVFCRALAIKAGDWVILSLTFLPVFLCSGVLLATGAFLSRVYYNEVKSLKVSYRGILKQSWELLIGVSYLSLPLILAYLLLWMLMGVFYLLKEIPAVGEFLGVILSFGPFLLVLGSLVLSFFNLFLLFFVSPTVAFKSGIRLKLAEDVFTRLKTNVFTNIVFFSIALLPLVFVVGILCVAAAMTGANFSIPEKTLSVALQWFFIMIPFCALLAPSVIFFFNFAVESYALMQNKQKKQELSEMLS